MEERQASDTWSEQRSHANDNRKLIKAVCVFLGIALGVSAGSQVLDLELPIYWIVLGFGFFVAAGLFLSHFLLLKVVLPSLTKYSKKARLLWISICLLSGLFLVLTVPITVYPKPQVVRIVATGDKNPASEGSEVWLATIISGDWAAPLHLESCKGNWVLIDKSLVSETESQPSELTCTIRTDQDIYLQFGMHEWSGKMRVSFENQVLEEDLYASNGGLKQIHFAIQTSQIDKIFRAFLFILGGISIGFILLSALLQAANYPTTPLRADQIKPVKWYWFTLIMFVSWMVYLLVFWPGFFSPDTAVQFHQIATGHYTNWHPAFHTMVLGLTTRLWFSTIPAIILQIIFLSGLMGWGIQLITESGAPRWLAWSIAVFLAISPAIGLILLNPWKDVAYGISLVALCLMIFYLIHHEYQNFSLGFWVLFVLVCTSVALFRLNGAPVALGALLVLMGLDHRRWKSYLFVLVLTLCLWKGVTGPFYTVMNVDKSPEAKGENMGIYAVGMYLLNTHASSGTILTPEEKELLTEVFPEEGGLDIVALSKHTRQVLPPLVKASLRNPQVTLDFILMRTAYIFQILQPPWKRIEHIIHEINDNPFGFAQDSKLPILLPYFIRIDFISESPEWDWLFWRNAFWMYLLVAAGAIASIRLKSKKYWAVLIPVFLNAIPLAFVSGGQISRYIFPTLLIGPLFGIGFFFLQPILAGQPERWEIDLPGSNGSNLITESLEEHILNPDDGGAVNHT